MRRPGRVILALVKTALAVALILVALALSAKMIRTRPQAKRAERPSPVLTVDVIEARAGRERIDVEAMGTVIPARLLVVQPEIPGRVVEVHRSVVAGGLIKEGVEIIRIDSRDYELAVSQQEALVEKASAALRIEEGRRAVAEQEWKLFESDIASTELGQELALRKPQIRIAEADLRTALDGLERAKINLERTSIRSPYNAIVLDEAVETGQLVTTQSKLATLAGTDEYWIQVSVPVTRLSWITVPPQGGGGDGSAARIFADGGPEETVEIQGEVIRLLGDLDPAGRMARLIVAVRDPLALGIRAGKPLLLSSYVRAEIDGRQLEGVFTVPRASLRGNDSLWVIDEESRLEVRKVEVVREGSEDVVIGSGLKEGDLVVSSAISSPIPGMVLRPGGGEGKAPGASEPGAEEREDPVR